MSSFIRSFVRSVVGLFVCPFNRLSCLGCAEMQSSAHLAHSRPVPRELVRTTVVVKYSGTPRFCFYACAHLAGTHSLYNPPLTRLHEFWPKPTVGGGECLPTWRTACTSYGRPCCCSCKTPLNSWIKTVPACRLRANFLAIGLLARIFS